MIVYVSSRYIIQEKVNSSLILKYILHLINKRVVTLKQDLLFSFNVIYLLFLYYKVFVNPFHSILLQCIFVFYKEYLAKRALVNYSFYDKII